MLSWAAAVGWSFIIDFASVVAWSQQRWMQILSLVAWVERNLARWQFRAGVRNFENQIQIWGIAWAERECGINFLFFSWLDFIHIFLMRGITVVMTFYIGVDGRMTVFQRISVQNLYGRIVYYSDVRAGHALRPSAATALFKNITKNFHKHPDRYLAKAMSVQTRYAKWPQLGLLQSWEPKKLAFGGRLEVEVWLD